MTSPNADAPGLSMNSAQRHAVASADGSLSDQVGGSQYGPVQVLDGYAHLGDVYNTQYHYHVQHMYANPREPHVRYKQQEALAPAAGPAQALITTGIAKDIIFQSAQALIEKAGLRSWEPAVQRRFTFEAQLATAVNQWLGAIDRRFAYIEYHTGDSGQRIDISAGVQIAEVAQSAGLPAIFLSLSLERFRDDGQMLDTRRLVKYTLLMLAAQLLELSDNDLSLSSDASVSTRALVQSADPHVLDLQHCGQVLKEALRLVPANLCLVVVVHPSAIMNAENVSSDCVCILTDILRSACVSLLWLVAYKEQR